MLAYRGPRYNGCIPEVRCHTECHTRHVGALTRDLDPAAPAVLLHVCSTRGHSIETLREFMPQLLGRAFCVDAEAVVERLTYHPVRLDTSLVNSVRMAGQYAGPTGLGRHVSKLIPRVTPNCRWTHNHARRQRMTAACARVCRLRFYAEMSKATSTQRPRIWAAAV